MDPIQPIIGRTHTDLFKTRGRLTSIGGKNGFKLTYFRADGFSYFQIGAFFLGLLIWSMPLVQFFGVPWLAWGGLSTGLLLAPPIALAWAADRTLPNNKSLLEWLTTRYRYHFAEKRKYVGGKPSTTTMRVNLSCQVWSPEKEGLSV